MRGCLLGLCIFVCPFPSQSSAAQKPTDKPGNPADERLAKAREWLARADEHAQFTSWDRAIECYGEVLALFPENPQAWFGTARCNEAKKETSEAIRCYRRLANLKMAPNDFIQEASSRIEALSFGKLESTETAEYQLATALLQQAAALKKQIGERASASEESLAKAHLAITRLEATRTKMPGYTPLYLDLGLGYELIGNADSAIKSFARYLDDYAKLDIPFGQLQRDIKIRHDLLLAEPKAKARRLSAEQVAQLTSEAVTAEDSGEVARAAAAYERILSEYPWNYQARFRLASCYKIIGRKAEALDHFRATAKVADSGMRVCELAIEEAAELALPSFPTEHSKLFQTAIEKYEAARSAQLDRYKWWHQPIANGRIRDLCNSASADLGRLLTETKYHPKVLMYYGLVYDMLCTTVDTSQNELGKNRGRAIFGLLLYIKWYTTCFLPDTHAVKEYRLKIRQAWGGDDIEPLSWPDYRVGIVTLTNDQTHQGLIYKKDNGSLKLFNLDGQIIDISNNEVQQLKLTSHDHEAGTTAVLISGMRSPAPLTWKDDKPFDVAQREGIPQLLNRLTLPTVGEETTSISVVRNTGIDRTPDKLLKTVRSNYESVKEETRQIRIGLYPATCVSFEGTLWRTKTPFNPVGERVIIPNYRKIIVIFETRDAWYYVTFQGPTQSVEKNQKSFELWLSNFR